MTASKRNGTIYTGSTSNLVGRAWEHKHKVYEGFTKKYTVDKLVWYEESDDITDAIYRERQIKKWKREWKIKLIEQFNPLWKDLYTDLL